MNIVLDIDGTLVNEPNKSIDSVLLRPYLKYFLQTCFEVADNVSIWSAAQMEWIQLIYNRHLREIMKELGKEFHFIYDRKKCVISYERIDGSTVFPKSCKPLKKLWNKPSYTKYNTLILDNTPYSYRRNYGNAIAVPTFTGNARDDYLYVATGILKHIRNEFTKCGNVRAIKKALPNAYTIPRSTFIPRLPSILPDIKSNIQVTPSETKDGSSSHTTTILKYKDNDYKTSSESASQNNNYSNSDINISPATNPATSPITSPITSPATDLPIDPLFSQYSSPLTRYTNYITRPKRLKVLNMTADEILASSLKELYELV